jgi:hypothetical protein
MGYGGKQALVNALAAMTQYDPCPVGLHPSLNEGDTGKNYTVVVVSLCDLAFGNHNPPQPAS